MVKQYSDRFTGALKGLPPRQPRGSPGNMLRAFMMPLLMKGLTAEEAKQQVIRMLQEVLDEATQG